jgi:hypothetical protein
MPAVDRGGRFRGVAGGAALALIAVGCGPTAQSITMPSTASFTPTPDQASIIIVQPNTRFRVNILDGQGRLVAQVNDRSRTVVRVPPGPVRLYAIIGNVAEAGDRIEGTVRAGRTYYATLSVRGGGFGGLAFRALNPRSHDNRWEQRDAYIAKTPLIEMDPTRVPIAMGQIGDTAPLLKKIDANIEKLSPAHRTERTIEPEDGL